MEVLGKGRFGKNQVLVEIHQGSVFGELSFFDQLAAWDPNLARILLLDLGKVLAYRSGRQHQTACRTAARMEKKTFPNYTELAPALPRWFWHSLRVASLLLTL